MEAVGMLRLVQVGDVHFPDPANQTAPIDAKDRAFPSRVSSAIGIQPLTAVCRKLTKLIEEYDPEAIAFMGDFTDRGDNAGLKAGAEFIARMIPPDWTRKHPGKTVVCIGNHDIARADAAPPRERFENVNKILTTGGFPEAAIDSPTSIDCEVNNVKISVYGINSCLGCGETRFLPPLLAPVVAEELKKIVAASTSPSILDQLIESIDTPAIDEQAIDDLIALIREKSTDNLNIVCGHHNILPQTTPRIAPYAELLNAGAFRTSLLSVGRPIVYLHGHIHQDPYEVVLSPRNRKSSIISISAPVLRDGFNLIEIISDGAGLPLGVRVRPFRRNGSHVDEMAGYDIPIRSVSDALFNLTRESRELIDKMQAIGPFYYSDILRNSGLDKNKFEAVFEELMWSGIIQILNKDLPADQWRLMRAV